MRYKESGGRQGKMANLAERFFNYSTRVMGLGQHLESIQDGRIGPQHSLASILAKTIACIVTSVPSLNQMEKVIKEGTLNKVGGASTPSADTIGYALERVCTKDLDTANDAIITKARRNKSVADTTVEGYRVCAIDGTGIFSTKSERLGKELHYRRGVHGEKIKEPLYLEHALGVSYVGGSGPKLMLALERIPRNKGETTVAVEVLEKLYHRHYRYCDMITVDALYAKAPFINTVLSQNKDVVVRVKQDNYSIIKDADAIFDQRQPNEEHDRIRRGEKRVYYNLKIWDDDEFTSWESVSQPLRCIKIEVTKTYETSAGTVINEECYTTHLVTTCPKETVPALTVWKIAHARWDIENTGFNFLKNHFQLEHAYSYTSAVTDAMLRLFVIAFNLFQLFVKRNLRSFNPKKDTLVEIIRQIHDGLVEIRRDRRKRDLLIALE